jgi:hypothetical protein
MTIVVPVRAFAEYFEMATMTTPTPPALPVATGGLGLGWGDEVYTGGLPIDPVKNCTVIISTSGMVQQGNIRYPAIQLSFYHTTQATAAARAEEAFTVLKDKNNWTIGSWRVLDISPIQEPFFLKRTNENIYVYAFNINLTIVAA